MEMFVPEAGTSDDIPVRGAKGGWKKDANDGDLDEEGSRRDINE